jgi:hypothetical protein
MKSHWLRPGVLAAKLARGEISNREVAHFLLGNMLLGSVTYYGGFTWSNSIWNVLSLWQFAIEVVIVIYGLMRCYDAAGGDGNPAFIAQFTCLAFPISLWTSVGTWLVYWTGVWLLHQGIIRVSVDDLQIARNIAYVGGGIRWFWTAAAVLGFQLVFFVWMRKSLRSAYEQRNHSNP